MANPVIFPTPTNIGEVPVSTSIGNYDALLQHGVADVAHITHSKKGYGLVFDANRGVFVPKKLLSDAGVAVALSKQQQLFILSGFTSSIIPVGGGDDRSFAGLSGGVVVSNEKIITIKDFTKSVSLLKAHDPSITYAQIVIAGVSTRDNTAYVIADNYYDVADKSSGNTAVVVAFYVAYDISSAVQKILFFTRNLTRTYTSETFVNFMNLQGIFYKGIGIRKNTTSNGFILEGGTLYTYTTLATNTPTFVRTEKDASFTCITKNNLFISSKATFDIAFFKAYYKSIAPTPVTGGNDYVVWTIAIDNNGKLILIAPDTIRTKQVANAPITSAEIITIAEQNIASLSYFSSELAIVAAIVVRGSFTQFSDLIITPLVNNLSSGSTIPDDGRAPLPAPLPITGKMTERFGETLLGVRNSVYSNILGIGDVSKLKDGIIKVVEDKTSELGIDITTTQFYAKYASAKTIYNMHCSTNPLAVGPNSVFATNIPNFNLSTAELKFLIFNDKDTELVDTVTNNADETVVTCCEFGDNFSQQILNNLPGAGSDEAAFFSAAGAYDIYLYMPYVTLTSIMPATTSDRRGIFLSENTQEQYSASSLYNQLVSMILTPEVEALYNKYEKDFPVVAQILGGIKESDNASNTIIEKGFFLKFFKYSNYTGTGSTAGRRRLYFSYNNNYYIVGSNGNVRQNLYHQPNFLGFCVYKYLVYITNQANNRKDILPVSLHSMITMLAQLVSGIGRTRYDIIYYPTGSSESFTIYPAVPMALYANPAPLFLSESQPGSQGYTDAIKLANHSANLIFIKR